MKVLHFWLNQTGQVSHPINQMLERLKRGGSPGADGKLAIRRRVTRLVGLLVDVAIPSDDHVLPILTAMTASLHASRRPGEGAPPRVEEPA